MKQPQRYRFLAKRCAAVLLFSRKIRVDEGPQKLFLCRVTFWTRTVVRVTTARRLRIVRRYSCLNPLR